MRSDLSGEKIAKYSCNQVGLLVNIPNKYDVALRFFLKDIIYIILYIGKWFGALSLVSMKGAHENAIICWGPESE